MKNKQLLLAVICLLILPITISCTDSTSTNSREEEILEEVREDSDRRIEESNRQFEEQEREREIENEARIAECQRTRAAFATSPAEIERIERDCETSLGFF